MLNCLCMPVPNLTGFYTEIHTHASSRFRKKTEHENTSKYWWGKESAKSKCRKVLTPWAGRGEWLKLLVEMWLGLSIYTVPWLV